MVKFEYPFPLSMELTNIYVLKLHGGKWYVGKSNNVNGRYQQHLCGQGSTWTRKYKPISLEKTITNVSPFEEDKITKEYMSKYGIANVRGGSYCDMELSDFHINALQMEIWGAKDLCAKCGRKGHWIKDCYAKTDISGNNIADKWEWECEYCDRTFTTKFGCMIHEKSCNKADGKSGKGTCYRCGRTGHYSTACYARKDIDGYDLF